MESAGWSEESEDYVRDFAQNRGQVKHRGWREWTLLRVSGERKVDMGEMGIDEWRVEGESGQC